MRRIRLFLIPILLLTLSSCRAYPLVDETFYLIDNDTKVVKRDIPFKNVSYSYPSNKASYLTTYYFNDDVIPYVSIEDFIKSIDYYENDLVSQENYTYTYNSYYPRKIMVDPALDTITISNLGFYPIDEIQFNSDNSYYKYLNLRFDEDSDDSNMVLELNKYNLDIKEAFNKALIPFHIVNTLFSHDSYYYTFYTENKYVGTHFEDNNVFSYNYQNCIPYSLKYFEYNYNIIDFVFNEYYGLKNYYNYDISNMLKQYKNQLLSKDSSLTYFSRFINELEDCHTSLAYNYDYFSSDNNSKLSNRYTKSMSIYRTVLSRYDSAVSEKNVFKEGEDLTYLNNEIAFISFHKFNISGRYSPLKINQYLSLCKEKGIKDIIFDVSLNGGGDSFALAYILGMMTNDDICFSQVNVNTGHKLNEIFKVDVNSDGHFLDDDAYDNFNYYILSSGYSYSCSNEFISYCKEHKLATIIGAKSGGGACAVYPLVTPSGALLQVSGLYGFYDKNNSLIEDGVDVDYQIEYSDFFNANYLINFINLIKTNNEK